MDSPSLAGFRLGNWLHDDDQKRRRSDWRSPCSCRPTTSRALLRQVAHPLHSWQCNARNISAKVHLVPNQPLSGTAYMHDTRGRRRTDACVSCRQDNAILQLNPTRWRRCLRPLPHHSGRVMTRRSSCAMTQQFILCGKVILCGKCSGLLTTAGFALHSILEGTYLSLSLLACYSQRQLRWMSRSFYTDYSTLPAKHRPVTYTQATPRPRHELHL